MVKPEANGSSWRGQAGGDPLKLDGEEIELKREIERAWDGEMKSSPMVYCREGVAQEYEKDCREGICKWKR